jgi:hypothetical protein
VRLVALVAVVLLLAACGSSTPPQAKQPRLPRTLASSWRAQADAVAAALAAGDGCTARARATALQSSVIDAVNGHRVSPRFQETLIGAVNDLASRVVCTPPAPAPTPHGQPKKPKPHPPHEHGHGHGHGKKK